MILFSGYNQVDCLSLSDMLIVGMTGKDICFICLSDSNPFFYRVFPFCFDVWKGSLPDIIHACPNVRPLIIFSSQAKLKILLSLTLLQGHISEICLYMIDMQPIFSWQCCVRVPTSEQANYRPTVGRRLGNKNSTLTVEIMSTKLFMLIGYGTLLYHNLRLSKFNITTMATSRN